MGNSSDLSLARRKRSEFCILWHAHRTPRQIYMYKCTITSVNTMSRHYQHLFYTLIEHIKHTAHKRSDEAYHMYILVLAFMYMVSGCGHRGEMWKHHEHAPRLAVGQNKLTILPEPWWVCDIFSRCLDIAYMCAHGGLLYCFFSMARQKIRVCFYICK